MYSVCAIADVEGPDGERASAVARRVFPHPGFHREQRRRAQAAHLQRRALRARRPVRVQQVHGITLLEHLNAWALWLLIVVSCSWNQYSIVFISSQVNIWIR